MRCGNIPGKYRNAGPSSFTDEGFSFYRREQHFDTNVRHLRMRVRHNLQGPEYRGFLGIRRWPLYEDVVLYCRRCKCDTLQMRYYTGTVCHVCKGTNPVEQQKEDVVTHEKTVQHGTG